MPESAPNQAHDGDVGGARAGAGAGASDDDHYGGELKKLTLVGGDVDK